LGISRLAALIENDWGTSRLNDGLESYSDNTEQDLLAAARLIASLYANMNEFPVFVALSWIYFAAVSFSETARRLDRSTLASSFLLRDHPLFGPASSQLLERSIRPRSPSDSRLLIEDIHRLIEPFNIAGLGDPLKKNWYPVDAEDLFRSAWKLGASREDIEKLLDRCGFYPEPVACKSC
jgi:FADH2 O2-dependent halogenase